MNIVSRTEESVTVDVSDIPQYFANAVRRMVIREVPTMAVEEVLIIENTSPLTNEVLSHRLSLIPFVTDLDNYNLPEECSCQSRLGCEKCVVRFVLHAEATDKVITVYSRDIQPETSSGIVRPFSGDIPVVMLAPGQRVELELYVRLGKGRKHSKWQSGIATLYEQDGKRYLYIESYGFLTPSSILKEAVNIVARKLGELEDHFMRLVSSGEQENS